MNGIKTSFNKSKFLLVVFLVNLLVAFIAIAPFIIKSGGLFTLCDDFDAQEIPFNIFCNQAIKSGDIFWNWNIDIGSDFISTFSFYNLGSPFFWITLLFPAKAFPYLIGWVYMLKYAVAGLTSYIFIKRFVENKWYALIGSMLYAFSGFQATNLVFYHFHDVVALFPLLMVGLDKLIVEKKKGFFAFSVFINAFVNYFFFVGEVIFLVIYYVIRFISPNWKSYKKAFVEKILRPIGSCFVEGIMGVAMAGVLFVPSIFYVLSNSRASEHIAANAALTFDTADVLKILKGLFFPADIMSRQTAVSSYGWWTIATSDAYVNMDWNSIAAYLPLFGMFLVLVYVLNKKNDWISRLLKVCMVIALVPILNNIFVFLNSTLYRRWYYMPVLVMALASAMVLEKREEYKLKKPLFITLGIMVFYLAYMTIYPWDWFNVYNDITYVTYKVESGIIKPGMFALYMIIGFAGVLASAWVIKNVKKHFAKIIIVMVAVYCVGTTALCIYQDRVYSTYESSESTINEIVNTGYLLESDTLPYRYRIHDWYHNIALSGYLSGRNSFMSTISPSITEFYQAMGMDRKVHGPDGPVGTNEILSVGYYVIDAIWNDKLVTTIDNGLNQYNVYWTDNSLPIGFTYDTYMLYSDFENVETDRRALGMLKTLIIKDEDEAEVSKVLRKYNPTSDGDFGLWNRDEMIKEHNERSEDFHYDTSSFGMNLKADNDKYAFFSVPYDKNWSVKVNGKEQSIIDVNGLMAVPVFAGDNTLEFEYNNKSVILGCILTILGFVVFAGYTVYYGGFVRKQKIDKR